MQTQPLFNVLAHLKKLFSLKYFQYFEGANSFDNSDSVLSQTGDVSVRNGMKYIWKKIILIKY